MGQWKRWQDWIVLVGGVWLFVTPWLFGYSGEAGAGNAWMVGVILVLAALWGLAQPLQLAAPAVNVIAGLWLLISPWVVGFTAETSAAWNAWIVGVLAAALAGWVITAIRRAQPHGRQVA